MAHARKKYKKSSPIYDERRFSVRGVRRNPVDMSKFSKALVGLAMAAAERDAQAEHDDARRGDDQPEATAAHTPPGSASDA